MSFLSLLVMVKVFCLGGRSLRCLLTKQVPKLHSVKEKETVGSTARPTRATGREGPFLIYEGGRDWMVVRTPTAVQMTGIQHTLHS